MLLLSTSTLQLHEFPSNPPDYAVLSYTWNTDDVVYEDLSHPGGAPDHKPGFARLQSACVQARNQKIPWLWSDALCVDRRSSAAISESINGLWQVCRGCVLCIVHLHDFPSDSVPEGEKGFCLARCSWARNVWALPNLIFSKKTLFYSREWTEIGTKASLARQLSCVTGIDEPVLKDHECLEDYSIGKRMSWASDLCASQVEDTAYSLLGIFGVSMPILYGEGCKSFQRLQQEILKDTDDYSLFDWQPLGPQEYRGILARCPTEFQHFRTKPKAPARIRGHVQLHSAGITIQTTFWREAGDLVLPLYGMDGPISWILLSHWDGNFVRRIFRPKTNIGCSSSGVDERIVVKRDVSPWLSNNISGLRNTGQKYPCDPHKQPNSNTDCCSELPDASEEIPVSRSLSSDSQNDISVATHTASLSNVGSLTTERVLAVPSDDQDQGAYQKRIVNSFLPTLNHLDATGAYDEHATPSRRLLEGASKFSAIYEDMDHFEASSQESGQIDQGHPFSKVTEELTDILVEQFRLSCIQQRGKRSMLSWPPRVGKRPRLACPNPYMETEQYSDPEDDNTVVVRHAGARASRLACPFYLKDKAKYVTCMTRHDLRSIDEVKEHLWAVHRQPNFCPVCKDTFGTRRARDDHIRSRTCTRRSSPTFDGITGQQVQQLAQQPVSPWSIENTWFEIWVIIFPQTRWPSSPFYSTQQELDICALRDFWKKHGQNIISDVLEKRCLQEYSLGNEERNLDALDKTVLNNAIDKVIITLNELE